jgi:hypothetical protein
MMPQLRQELRQAFPAWAIAVLLPAPAVITSRNGGLGLTYFFVASLGLVATVFWRDFHELSGPQRDDRLWIAKLAAAAIWLFAAWLIFAASCLPLAPSDAMVTAALGFFALIPALCVVPWMLAVTRNPFIAIVFTLTLVACMKLLGCIVVVLVYGWEASERGYTGLPWLHPNLLVWSFWGFTAALAAIGYRLGAAKFARSEPAPEELRGVQA